MGSRLVEVKRALVAALEPLPSLADVSVTYAYRPNLDARERIFLGRARATHRVAGLRAGKTHREEAMTFDLVVLTEAVGGEAEEAEDRAVNVLGLIVEDYLADHRTLDGSVTGLNWITVSGVEVVSMFNDRGWLAEATFSVSYEARLT